MEVDHKKAIKMSHEKWGAIFWGAVLFSLVVMTRVGFSYYVPLSGDEVWELTAAHMIVRSGVPVFPSGVIWTSGGPFVYWQALLVSFGHSDFLFRLPAVVSSGIAVWLLYSFGSRLWGRSSGLAAAFAAALDPGFIMWTSYGRAYAYLPFLVLLALRSLNSAAIDESPTRNIWTATVCLSVMVWTQVMTALTLPAFVVAYWIWSGKVSMNRLWGPVAFVCLTVAAIAGMIYASDPGVISTTQKLGIINWNIPVKFIDILFYLKEYADRFFFLSLMILCGFLGMMLCMQKDCFQFFLNKHVHALSLSAFLFMSLLGFSFTNYPGTHFITLPLAVFFLLGGRCVSFVVERISGGLAPSRRALLTVIVVLMFCLLSYPKAILKNYDSDFFSGFNHASYQYIESNWCDGDGVVDTMGGMNIYLEQSASIYNSLASVEMLGTGFFDRNGVYYSRLQNSEVLFGSDDLKEAMDKHNRLWFCLDKQFVSLLDSGLYGLVQRDFHVVFEQGKQVVFLYDKNPKHM